MILENIIRQIHIIFIDHPQPPQAPQFYVKRRPDPLH